MTVTKKSYRIVFEVNRDKDLIEILDSIPKTLRSEFVGLAVRSFKSKYEIIKNQILSDSAAASNVAEDRSEPVNIKNIF